MNYVDSCLQIYKTLIDSNSEEYSLSSDVKPLSLIDLISKKISSKQLREQYKKEIRLIIDSKLALLKIENEYKDELNRLPDYFNSVGGFTMSLVFWIEYNKIKITKEELYRISEAGLIGSLGYRLIDFHNDEGLFGKESTIIGNYFIHNYEEMILDIFRNDQDTFKILGRNVRLYSEVEFLEKRNRWKKCPFSWDEPEKIGYKSYPMYSVYELLLRKAEKDEKEIDSLFKGVLYLSTVMQMLDDFSDIEDDLTNGSETLIMSGFFEKFGANKKVSQEQIKSFLNEERITKFYTTIQSLFDKARKIFTDNEDDIMLLSVEIQNYNFNSHLL